MMLNLVFLEIELPKETRAFHPATDHHKLQPDLSYWNCESGLSTCAGCPAIERTVEGLEVCGTAWFILETTSSAI